MCVMHGVVKLMPSFEMPMMAVVTTRNGVTGKWVLTIGYVSGLTRV